MTETRELTDALRLAGHRLTEPRRLVWDVLRAATGHLTAEQITAQAQTTDTGINRASVYRSLSLFADLGLARETNLGTTDDASRWESAHPDDQFHLICALCSDVTHHAGSLVDDVRTHVSTGHGFTAQRIELSVIGICANCWSVRSAGGLPT